VNYTAIHYPTMLHEIKGPNGLGNVIPRELNVLIHLKHMNTVNGLVYQKTVLEDFSSKGSA
jgi:hypothetical protein